MLIVISGLAGSGKSTIADAIGRARGCPVLSVDPIESAIVRSGVPRSFETGLAAYVVAEAIADAHLAQGLDVVVDAANYAEPGRAMWRALGGKHELIPRIIECVVSDSAVHVARIASRRRGLAIAEPSWEVVQRQRAEWRPWPEAHLTLDAVDPVDVNVARALAYLSGP